MATLSGIGGFCAHINFTIREDLQVVGTDRGIVIEKERAAVANAAALCRLLGERTGRALK